MTALGNPALLERWSAALLEISALFARLTPSGSRDEGLDWPTFLAGYTELFAVPDEAGLRRAFDRHSRPAADGSGAMVLDALEWCAALRVDTMAAMAAHCRSPGSFSAAALDEGEQALVSVRSNSKVTVAAI